MGQCQAPRGERGTALGLKTAACYPRSEWASPSVRPHRALSAVTSNHIAFRIAKEQARPRPRTQLKYHIASLRRSVAEMIGFDLMFGHLAAHHAVDERRVGEHDRQQQDYRSQHDQQRRAA